VQLVRNSRNVLGVGFDIHALHPEGLARVVVSPSAGGLHELFITIFSVDEGDQKLGAVDVEDGRLAVNDGAGNGSCLWGLLVNNLDGLEYEDDTPAFLAWLRMRWILRNAFDGDVWIYRLC
jgi:hypothetical protein